MCYLPLKGSISPHSGLFEPSLEGNLEVPCGKCTACLRERSREWAVRCQHEISLHKQNSFITLTYNDENLKSSQEDFTSDIQKFWKRLRKQTGKKIGYIYSVEYGTKTHRPHFHALIFGHDFKNQKLIKKTKKGHPIFTSEELSKLWKNGHHSIGSATVQTAYYIASYALKKHSAVNETTGEIVSDYMRTSKRPSIGLNYLLKNKFQLVDSKEKLPRYYLKKLKESDPTLLQQYEEQRQYFITPKDDREKFAKYTIENSRTQKNHFREETNILEKKKIHNYTKDHLDFKMRQQLAIKRIKDMT